MSMNRMIQYLSRSLLGGILAFSVPSLSAENLSQGLQSYWSFDHNYGPDAGPIETTLFPLGGAERVASGRFGGAIAFNRDREQYLQTFAPVYAQGEDMTYAAWYRLDEPMAPGERHFILETPDEDHALSYGLRIIGGQPVGQVYTADINGVKYNFELSNATGRGGEAEVWQHVAIVYDADAGEVRAYLNGLPAGSMTVNAPLPSSEGLIVGGHRDGTGRNFQGKMDALAIWNRALSPEEIEALQTTAPQPAPAATPTTVLGDWTLFPDYGLDDMPSVHPDRGLGIPESWRREGDSLPEAIPFQFQDPTDRAFPPLDFDFEPPFTVEMWLVDHAREPTGVAALIRNADGTERFRLQYFNNGISFYQDGGDSLLEQTEWRSAHERYWRHAVLVVAESGLTDLFLNGERVGRTFWAPPADGGPAFMELAAFNRADPRMRIEHGLHRLRVHSRALPTSEVVLRFEDLAERVSDGILFPEGLHLNAGPALFFGEDGAVRLSLETDRPTQISVDYGEAGEPLSETVASPVFRRIHQVQLTGLAAETDYTYRVTLNGERGERLVTDGLTFTSPPEAGRATRFAVIGDTEARPWINHAVASGIVGHDPDFVVHLGDMTDNGQEDRKSQWSHEYFAAMTPLQARIPVFAVPGNGEGSALYWFRRYFDYPRDQGNAAGYYRFQYGDTEFFMLDSNRRSNEFGPGGEQYEWLDAVLSQSDALWKVVCFHHVGTRSTYGDNAAVDSIEALCDKWDVHLVMNGHKHTYERSRPRRNGTVSENGTVYIVSGGAGGNLKDPEGETNRSSFTRRNYRGYHYLIVEDEGFQLRIECYDLEGRLIDAFALSEDNLGRATWIEKQLPQGVSSAGAADGADPDQDGGSNLLEYALATDPGEADDQGGLAPEANPISGAFEYLVPVRTDDPSLRYTLELSENLTAWYPVQLLYNELSEAWSTDSPLLRIAAAGRRVEGGHWLLRLRDESGFSPTFCRMRVDLR